MFILTFLSACNNKRKTIEQVVSRMDTADLSELKNMCIQFRSSGLHYNSSIYLVSAYDKNCSPYGVEVDNRKKNILEIRNDLVLESCGTEVFDRIRIVKAMKKYFELDVCLICVDQQGDVYINPTEQERPTLMKIANGAQPKDRTDFSQYKNDWYVRNGTFE